MEMEPEKVSARRGLSADTASYRCAACHGDEDPALGHPIPIRGRAKSRSLSAAPALASTKEFRYGALGTRRRPQQCPRLSAHAIAHRAVWSRPRSRRGWRGHGPQVSWTSVPTPLPEASRAALAQDLE